MIANKESKTAEYSSPSLDERWPAPKKSGWLFKVALRLM